MAGKLEKTIFAGIEAAIADAIKERTKAIIKDHLEQIQKELEASVDQIALSVARSYDLQYQTDRLVITVRKGITNVENLDH